MKNQLTVFSIFLTILFNLSNLAAGAWIDTPNSNFYLEKEQCKTQEPPRIRFGLFGLFSLPSGPSPLFTHEPECVAQLRRPTIAPELNCKSKVLDEVYSRDVVEVLRGKAESNRVTQHAVNQTSLAVTALKGNYCHKMIATNVSEIFLPDRDVPADFINLWTADYLRESWSNISTNDLAKPIESLDILYKLNVEAASLWKRMLACYDGDAEKARFSYFSSEWNCMHGGASVDKDLKKDIALFLLNVTNAFSTAKYFNPKMKFRDGFDLQFKLQMGDTDLVSKRAPLPDAHPLFTQALLQTLLDAIPMGNDLVLEDLVKELKINEKGGGFTNSSLNRYLSLGQTFNILPEGYCTTFGLWPTANIAVQNALRMRGLELLVTSKTLFPRGGQVRDEGFTSNNCNKSNLPQFYHHNMMHVALMVRGINRRYGVDTIPDYAKADPKFVKFDQRGIPMSKSSQSLKVTSSNGRPNVQSGEEINPSSDRF